MTVGKAESEMITTETAATMLKAIVLEAEVDVQNTSRKIFLCPSDVQLAHSSICHCLDLFK